MYLEIFQTFIHWDDHISLLFYSINILLYIDWFQNVDIIFHFGYKPQHHQDLLPFLYSCIWFANILEDFC